MHEPNPLGTRSLATPPHGATRYSNVRSDSRALLSSSDVNDHRLSVASQGTPVRHALGVAGRGSMNGGVRPTLFAGTETPTDTMRRGRGLLVAFVLHLLAITPFLVSRIHVESQPTPSLEPLGVTFVMTPLRGVGSPAPASETEAEPEPVEAAKPVPPPPETAAVTEQTPLTASSLAPLVAPSTLEMRPPQATVYAGPVRGLASETTAAPPVQVSGVGSGGVGSSPLPPAIGAPSGQSNWAGLVLGRLEQFRRYPAAARRSRQEGICYVRFTIDRQGRVLAASLERSSGHEPLDREAVALVGRADPFPAPPPELEGNTVTLTVPVEFFLRR